MGKPRGGEAAICLVVFFWFWSSSNALLSPKGVNFEGKVELLSFLVP